MRAISLTATLATTLVIFAMTSPQAVAEDEYFPTAPTGSLSAFPTLVEKDEYTTLTWDITHPEKIDDVVDIEGPGTLVPKRDLVMDVRVIGASVKRVWLRNGVVTRWEWVPTESKMSYNNGSYERLWFDTQDNVEPDTIVHSQTVQQGDEINFGAHYTRSNGGWSNLYTSTNTQHNVIALRNGDTPPTTTPLYQQPTIETFILPYLDDNGNIKIGPRDILYLMELTHTDRNHGGFDLQDMCILVTFIDRQSAPIDTSGNKGIGATSTGLTAKQLEEWEKEQAELAERELKNQEELRKLKADNFKKLQKEYDKVVKNANKDLDKEKISQAEYDQIIADAEASLVDNSLQGGGAVKDYASGGEGRGRRKK